jgi:hypothetical protein
MTLPRRCQWIVIFAACAWARADPPAGKVVPDFAALARDAMTTLPAPPVWDMTQPAAPWTIDDIKAELAKITDHPPRVNSLRTNLLRPEHAWFSDLSTWFQKAHKPLKIRYVNELWDCDNFANCFVAFADVIALRGGETRGSLCIGWAIVHYKYSFAGARAGITHAVVIVGTSKGLYMVEPQSGMMTALRKFPNRDTIDDIFF